MANWADPLWQLRYLEASLEEMDAYLTSDEVYWVQPGMGEAAPVITLGNILFALRIATLGDQQEPIRLRKIEQSYYALQVKRQVAWEKKAQRELGARFNQFRTYLEEWQRGQDGAVAAYTHEVRWLVIAVLLIQQLPAEAGDNREAWMVVERMLKAQWEAGAFIWPEELASVFPEQPFWMLYGQPKIQSGEW